MALTRCPHTHKVTNKYTGEILYVPCGKCLFCRTQRQKRLTAMLSHACEVYRYSLFVTLTYDNENVPLAYNDGTGNYVLDRKRFNIKALGSDGRNTEKPSGYEFVRPAKYGSDVLPPAPQGMDVDGFGVVNKYDIQKFLKRLRRLIDYDKERLLEGLPRSERRFKYFVASEYGPNTLRPHYHGILWCEDKRLSDAISVYVYKAWTLCHPSRLDVQYVSGAASSYVSSYINSSVNLPRLLQGQYTRPFYLASQFVGLSQDEEKKVFDEISNGVVQRTRNQVNANGRIEHVITKLPFQIVSRLFPKCIGFRDMRNDIGALLKIYARVVSIGKLSLPLISKLGSDYYDALHVNPDESHGSFRWQNVRCLRACNYVCHTYNINEYDYVRILQRYYDNLDKLYLKETYEELQEFVKSDVTNSYRYMHVLSDNSFIWLTEHLPKCFRSSEDVNDYFGVDFFNIQKCVEWTYYGCPSSDDLFYYYDYDEKHDIFTLDLDLLRADFDVNQTIYMKHQFNKVQDAYDRKLMSKKINNSKYASILNKYPLL